MSKTRNLQAENDKLREQLNFAIGQLQSIKANALNDPYVGGSRESAMRALALQASQAVKMIELGIVGGGLDGVLNGAKKGAGK